MNALRVALVHGRADPRHDGVADYTAHLADALRASDAGGLEVVDVAVDPGARGTLRAARAVREAEADLVHVQFAPSAFGFSRWPGLLPDLVGARPVVTTVHEYGWWSWAPWVPDAMWGVGERRGWIDRETGRLVPRSAVVLTTNDAHAATLLSRADVHAHRAPLPPNVAVDPAPPSRAATRRGLGVPDDAEVAVFFGFVHPVKGLRYLVNAVAALRTERPQLHLLIVGGFTSLALPEDEAEAFRAELTAHIAASGAADRVTITGHRPAHEVSAILAASDLAAFPFTAGATLKSGAVVAALQHGLPTIVTRRPDAPADRELVDGRAVVVAPQVRDVDVLVTALRRLAHDEELRRRLAIAGPAITRDRTWQALAEQHLDLYRSLVADERVAAP